MCRLLERALMSDTTPVKLLYFSSIFLELSLLLVTENGRLKWIFHLGLMKIGLIVV